MKRTGIYLVIFFAFVALLLGQGECIGKSTRSAERPVKWQFTYDEAGYITKIVNPWGRETKISYKFDKTKRLLKRLTRELPDGTRIIQEFDCYGRYVKMTDTAGTVHYKYDKYDNLTDVRRDGYPRISYTYDTLGHLKSLSLGKGLTVRYSYDFLGRLSKMETPAGDISYDYLSGEGMVIRRLPNGIRTEWEYQPDGRLQSISHAKDTNLVAQFTYSYRPDGLINAVKEWTPRGEKVIKYEYDKVHRLSAVADSFGQKIQYEYDKLGNRLALTINGQERSSRFNWAGQMVRHNGQACSHDAAGNLTAYSGKNGERLFEFNAMNLLKSVTKDGVKVGYQYGGNGYLIARTASGQKASFVPDPFTDTWRPLLATDAEGKQTFYVWDGGTPLIAISGKEAKFFLHDHLRSVRCVANEKGKVTEYLDYNPFGMPQKGFEGANLQPGFAGLFFDSQVSMYLTRARAYNPETGRFLQRDPQHRVPMGSQKDFSAYAYCGADPVNYVDSKGAQAKWVWGPENWAWQVSHKPMRLFDATYAKKWYAKQSETTISSAGGRGICAGLTGTAWDIIGGYIPGKAANQGQAYAQIAWSLALSGGLSNSLPETANMLANLGVGRTIGSSIINFAEGDFTGAGLDLLSLGGTALQVKGDFMKYSPHLGPTRQYNFGFIVPEVVQTANRYGIEADWIGVFGHFNDAATAWNIGMKDWNSVAQSSIDQIGNPSGANPMQPSNVGGIYLRGAGEALKHLGPLKGIAIDKDNGRLVLIAEGERQVDLPPLRMDDVVTIFRSVYEHGEAPLVSIDPMPDDLNGPEMDIRHGAGTANTYVGWVLFEADRLMKTYGQGYDNVTRNKVKLGIEDYKDQFDLGSSVLGEIWERFWIVPAEVNRCQSTNAQLTLFDVPLKVNTQRMELHQGKLVPAKDDSPSESAKNFSDWFTRSYDEIAENALSMTPKGSDINTPVKVFAELRRIALVTAIAETLRDQGVPMPSWMRNYTVKPFHMPARTPSITVEATSSGQKRVIESSKNHKLEPPYTRSITGGVNLASADKDIHLTKGASESEKLAPEVSKKIAAVPMLSPVYLKENGKQIQAVALPGNDALDLGANQLIQTDLVVPVQRGTEIGLVRRFNSFFQPMGALGSGWTFDLPRLEKQLLPVKRTGDKTEYKTAYQLTSPFNTYSESFKEHKFVPETNGDLLVPKHTGIFLGLADTKDDKIGFATKVLIFRDGREWHFDGSGDFVAQMDRPLTVIYRRDGAQRIRRIEGWYGRDLRADIRIEYDKDGRVEYARGSNKAGARYKYNGSGALNRVDLVKCDSEGMCEERKESQDTIEYGYKDDLMTAIALNGEEVRQFEYGDRGQLIREQLSDGTERTYDASSAPEGMRITASTKRGSTSAEYDAAFRPLKRVFDDGTHIQWKYNADNDVEVEVFQPTGDRYRVNYSADGRHASWHLPNGDTFSTDYDPAGRFTALRQGNREILRQEWHMNGLPASMFWETLAVHPDYRDDNVLMGFLFTPPEKGPQFSQWQNIEYDELGRTCGVTDYSGSEIKIGYDKTGEPSILVSKRGGVKLDRDGKGRIKSVETSWGYRQNNTYDSKTGMLKEVEFIIGGNGASIRLDQGRATTVEQFDGGKFEIAYYNSDTLAGQLKEITCPNDVVLKYDYDSAGRLATVNCDGTYELKLAYDAQDRLVELAQVPASQ